MAERKLTDKIAEALHNLVELRIVTSVGKVVPDEQGHPTIDFKDAKMMATRINMLQGDISNSIDPEFATGEYSKLVGYHEQQVHKGQEIVRSNLQTLRELYELVQGSKQLDTTAE